jgi:hypothetical protein
MGKIRLKKGRKYTKNGENVLKKGKYKWSKKWSQWEFIKLSEIVENGSS